MKIDIIEDLQQLMKKQFDNIILQHRCACGGELSRTNELFNNPKMLVIEIMRDILIDGSVVVSEQPVTVPDQLILQTLCGRSVKYAKPCVTEHNAGASHYVAYVPVPGVYWKTNDSVRLYRYIILE